tara:strand:- start:50 stop:1183 length:1134 start_codon:yes stop_codon:yes gene_type:complete
MNLSTLRDYYTEMGIDINTLLQINRELTVGTLALEEMIEKSTEVKRDMLKEAKLSTFEHDWKQNFIEKEARKKTPFDIRKWPGNYVDYYSDGDLVIGAVKPGKEAGVNYKLSHYKKCKCDECKSNDRKPIRGGFSPNVHDMLPVIVDGNRNLAAKITYTVDKNKVKNYTPWTLDQIAKPLEDLLVQKMGRFGVELFGTILFRAAFNLDHCQSGDKWRMEIPRASLKLIQSILPSGKMRFSEGDEHTEFSVSSLFYFFDILGVNEDIKVHAKGRVSDFMKPVTWLQHDKGKRPNTLAFNGRTNTLLTYCEMIAIMLNRSSVGDSMIGYHRGKGIYPFKVEDSGLEHAWERFPLLSPNFSEQLDLDVTKGLGWLHSARD